MSAKQLSVIVSKMPLEMGLEDTFPASDFVAVVQPGPTPDLDEQEPEQFRGLNGPRLDRPQRAETAVTRPSFNTRDFA